MAVLGILGAPLSHLASTAATTRMSTTRMWWCEAGNTIFIFCDCEAYLMIPKAYVR